MCAPPRRRQAAELLPSQSATTGDDLHDDVYDDARGGVHDGAHESNTPRDDGDDDVRVP
jgi:hypothetical protein